MLIWLKLCGCLLETMDWAYGNWPRSLLAEVFLHLSIEFIVLIRQNAIMSAPVALVASTLSAGSMRLNPWLENEQN